jgi:hypothetical protein
MRSALQYLDRLLRHRRDEDDRLFDYAFIAVLIIVVAVLALVFLGDAVADLISLIGGRVDEATIRE